MAKNLVIVESPAKAKTIQGYLGKDFTVVSSYGHVRDLPKKNLGIDIKQDFKPEYEITPTSKKTISALKKDAKAAKVIWLATDEDREGEAIAWHLAQALKLKPEQLRRITFHEITEPAIKAAVDNPRGIDEHLVDAQQARRVLDRLVGYEISPILWRKVRPGLSAGRVQSVAVRLIVEREREIEAWSPQRSFKVIATLQAGNEQFEAELDKKLTDLDESRATLKRLGEAEFRVSGVKQTEGTRSPAAPFTTSTLQQEASRRLGYSVRQTMRLAQSLYESGAITYMRTDSVAVSETALAAAAKHISTTYGDKYLSTRRFSTKSKGAQEAHEAIRPTNPSRLSAGDAKTQKLYKLIHGRFLASQMAPALIKKTQVDITAGSDRLKASGEVLVFDGWIKAYPYSVRKDKLLPALAEGDGLKLISAQAAETLSQPPARYGEASLVRTLEEMGIGRPSTYAPVISTIQDRGYVVKEQAPSRSYPVKLLSLNEGQITEEDLQKEIGGETGKLLPTDTAKVVIDFLSKNFNNILDYGFTSKVESEFDDIARGNKAWNQMIKEFYQGFHTEVEAAAKVSRQEVSQARELGKDPASGLPVLARYGRYGPMLQLGEGGDDDQKPKFAPLPDGATIESITLEEALKMFELPRTLGQADGEDIKASIGRYGPYVQQGRVFASIPKDLDVFSISLEQALELIKAKAEGASKSLINKFENGLEVRSGRFGPYATDGKTNAKIPKNLDPEKLTQDQVQELIEQRKNKSKKR